MNALHSWFNEDRRAFMKFSSIFYNIYVSLLFKKKTKQTEKQFSFRKIQYYVFTFHLPTVVEKVLNQTVHDRAFCNNCYYFLIRWLLHTTVFWWFILRIINIRKYQLLPKQWHIYLEIYWLHSETFVCKQNVSEHLVKCKTHQTFHLTLFPDIQSFKCLNPGFLPALCLCLFLLVSFTVVQYDLIQVCDIDLIIVRGKQKYHKSIIQFRFYWMHLFLK